MRSKFINTTLNVLQVLLLYANAICAVLILVFGTMAGKAWAIFFAYVILGAVIYGACQAINEWR